VIGDANLDGILNVLDIVLIIAEILDPVWEDCDLESADANADGSVDVLDIVVLIGYVLNGIS
jgi:hypothetical protein